MSVDLTWALIRSNNSFVVKRNGCTFSTEPFNLAGKHSFKYSGLAQNKAVSIRASKHAICYTEKAVDHPASKVASSVTKPTVFKGRNARRISDSIGKKLADAHYRPDLIAAAKARVSALILAQNPKKITAKKVRANKLNKA